MMLSYVMGSLPVRKIQGNGVSVDNRIGLAVVDEVLVRNGLPETIGCVAFFAGDPPAIEELRARVVERWGGETRLRLVLEPPLRRLTERPRWALTPSFDPAKHVRSLTGTARPNEGDPAQSLDKWLAGQLREPMPAGLPPWRLLTLPTTPDSGFALALLAHHALFDGASVGVLLRLLLDGSAKPTLSPTPSSQHQTPRQPINWTRLARTLRAELRPGRALPSPREGATSEVSVSVLDQQSLRCARSLPDDAGATISQLLLCCATGALRSTYNLGNEAAQRGKPPVQAAIPVNLRTRQTAHELGNFAASARVPLPLHEPTPHARLDACRQLLADVGPQIVGQREVIRVLETTHHLRPWTLSFIAARGYSPTYAAVALTALKWRHPRAFLDHRPLLRIAGLPPLHRPGTANFEAVSYGQTVTLTVVSHAAPGTAQTLADSIHRELETMAGLTS
ncbi:wax ester/triacylglycerol synthase domain-containing protein [Streptomyces sp. NPDC048275]|uniref:wax ester/triacylglycerol synthase domain-containing protein n=1 Tax=Streptomyces sp. NPDC048275 TaxID=3155629 RepID=UPI0033E66354